MATSRGKFFGGRLATTELVDLEVVGHDLIIRSADKTLGRWPIDRIFQDESHLVSIVIGCGGDNERVELLDSNILSELPIKSTVWSYAKIKQNLPALWLWGLGSIAILSFLIWNSGLLTRYLVRQIPLDYERRVGDSVVHQTGWKPCELNKEQQAAAEQILDTLYKADPDKRGHIRLNWVADPMNNAFTLPGGSIYMFSGLLQKTESAEELAGILAHEIEHVERRHVLESLMNGLLLTALVNFVMGDVSAIILLDPSTAAQILSLRLSRDMERQADQGALRRLQSAGISPRGMVDFFARSSQDDPTTSKLSFLSTHPFTEERARFFEKAIPKDDNPFESFLAPDKWKALKTICAR